MIEFPYVYHKLECPECGRKILVERFLVGTNHTIRVGVICAECLHKKGLSEEFREKNPRGAEDIERWLEESK